MISLGFSYSRFWSSLLKKHRADQAVKAVLLDHYRSIREARRRFLIHPYDRVEALHDLRVGVRATRSILREMRRVFGRHKIQSELQWWATFARMTSEVRDLDVTLATLQQLDDEPLIKAAGGTRWFVEALQIKADSTRQFLEGELRSVPMKYFLRHWGQFLRDDSSSEAKLRWARKDILIVAGTLILKSHQRFMAAARAIQKDTPPEGLHDLRKKAKKLRYLMAGFGSYFSSKKVSSFIKGLKGFQDYLGKYQDGQVLRQRLATLSTDPDQPMPIEAQEVLKVINAWSLKKEDILRGQFQDQFMALVKAAPRHRYRALFK